jgi:hypothetical protein
MKLRNLFLVAVALVAGMASSAKAGFTDTVTPGLNGYHDASFEFIHFQNPAQLSVGDTFIGFNQINIKLTPNSLSTFNTIYALTSDTVASIAPNGQSFTVKATDTGPFSLQSILSGSGLTIPTGTIAMLMDTQSSTQANFNALNAPPNGATTMQGYLQNLANTAASGLKYDAAVGFKTGDNSSETVTLGTIGGVQITTATFNAALLNATPETVRTLASFAGGFSVLLNNTGLIFNNNVVGNDLLPHQVVIANGVGGGGNTNPNYSKWGTPGFEDSADILVNIGTPTGVPEPSSIVLMALGMSGLVGLGYRRRKIATV